MIKSPQREDRGLEAGKSYGIEAHTATISSMLKEMPDITIGGGVSKLLPIYHSVR